MQTPEWDFVILGGRGSVRAAADTSTRKVAPGGSRSRSRARPLGLKVRFLLTRGIVVLASSLIALWRLPPERASGQTEPTAHPARRLDVTRDTWVSEVGREADGNNGAAPRLKLKSIQEMTLLDVHARPLRGRTIRSAELHLKLAGEEPLRRVTVSSVGAEWFEGSGSGYAIQPGGATFRSRRHGDLPWSKTGGDLCHVVLGNGGTIWRMADAQAPDREGWQRIPVDPRVLEARVAGLSHGFLAFDDTGSEWSRSGDTYTLRIFPNRFVYSRDQNRDCARISRSNWVPTIGSHPPHPAICGSRRRVNSCRRARLSYPGLPRAILARPARLGS